MPKFYFNEIDPEGEAAADKLLMESGLISQKNGVMTEAGMDRLDRDREKIIDNYTMIYLSYRHTGIDSLFDCLWEEIQATAKRCHCSPRQIDFLKLRLLGNSYQEIADATAVTWGSSKTVVVTDIEAAAKTIQGCPYFGLWTVLSEVFRMPIPKIKDILN